jgi:hypothetical protein
MTKKTNYTTFVNRCLTGIQLIQYKQVEEIKFFAHLGKANKANLVL